MTAPRAHVGVTREGEGAQRLGRALAEHGLVPVVVPLISRAAPSDEGRSLRSAVMRAGRGDWIVVTSPNGADAVLGAVDAVADGVRVAAVGPATAERLAGGGWRVDLVPTRYDAASLATALVELAEPRRAVVAVSALAEPRRAVVAVSALADDTVEAALTADGWDVERVDAYRIVSRAPSPAEAAELAGCEVVTLASGSAAEVLARLQVDRPVVCMGRVTAERAAELGLDVRGVADPSTLAGLVAATVAALDRTEERHEEMNEQ